jgi:hypothetical protein
MWVAGEQVCQAGQCCLAHLVIVVRSLCKQLLRGGSRQATCACRTAQQQAWDQQHLQGQVVVVGGARLVLLHCLVGQIDAAGFEVSVGLILGLGKALSDL